MIGAAGVDAFGAPIEDSYFGVNECDKNATCTNIEGSYNCTCADGYRGDGLKCSEVNECREGTDNCHIDARCKNTDGSFECICDDGFFGNGVNCTDSDECGIEVSPVELDGILDPAYNSSECSEFAYCVNEIGAYNCTCDEGFQGDGWNCTDIDECKEGMDLCSGEGICVNSPGDYSCECDDGFFGDGFVCLDIDECGENNITSYDGIIDWGYGNNSCHENAVCANQWGFYNCTCLDGYFGTGENCINIDECDEGIHNCDDNAECTDTDGSYTCQCLDGFFGSGFICKDSDECGDNDEQEEISDGGVNYTDVNYNSHQCDASAVCLNFAGGFNCTCSAGFYGNGSDCADMDECGDSPITLTGGIWDTNYEINTCSDNATCTNFAGGYNCTCDVGYHGDGQDCLDLDECAPQLFTCDSTHCDVMNSQQLNFAQCDLNSVCTNTDGSYSCVCADGFESNNTDNSAFVGDCLDIDECATGTDLCDDNASCNNTIGKCQSFVTLITFHPNR